MQAPISKLTKKYQATIPEAVRDLLHLHRGDTIAFDIEGNAVHLRKATPVDLAFAQGIEKTLGEWESDLDDDAYHDL